ncbi:MAG TPA: Crp/Fnr family transcriptional regulator [Burkholderiales bacterium]|nr:Crp/Fnr family transcriptional regulator [Burkholderiales bacterium]
MPAAPIRIQEFLKNVPLFRELTDAELDRIAAGTAQVRAPAGTILFRRGEPCSGFHVIVYGQVKLAFGAADGAEKVVEILGPGSSFGEAVMFLEKPYVVFAETLSDALLLTIGKAGVFAELDRNPRFARKMLAGLALRLHGLVHDLEAYTLRSGTQRVIGYLLRDYSGEGEPQAPIDVPLATSKGVLASRLNITREHFSRILHDLSGAGLIEVHGRIIRILDPERLRAYDG